MITAGKPNVRNSSKQMPIENNLMAMSRIYMKSIEQKRNFTMKLFRSIVIAIVLLFIASAASAAWTVQTRYIGSAGDKILVRIDLVGDGTALSQNIWPAIKALGVRSGGYVYRVMTDPDGTSAPSGTYAVTLVDLMGDTATLAARSTTATEVELIAGNTTSGGYLSIYEYLLLTAEDIGSGNKTSVYLEMVP